jgi:spermidine synthase
MFFMSQTAVQTQEARELDVTSIFFGAAIFISAFLLFQVQPLIGKHVLPWFGGTPSVWTTCLFFFQLLLLVGYAYAHLLARRAAVVQRLWHWSLIAVAIILMLVLLLAWHSPLLPGVTWQPKSTENPVGHLLILLALSVGLPFFVLSTTGPLLQHWYIRALPGRSPYFLYAVSNIGSLLGLISYPVLIEPNLTTHNQSLLWGAGFLLFAAAVSRCAMSLGRNPLAQHSDEVPNSAPRPSGRLQALWFGLSACGSLALLATTNQICQDVSVVPLLWVVPLAVYLLSFILVFGRSGTYRRDIFQSAFLWTTFISTAAMFHLITTPVKPLIFTLVLNLFVTCMVLHGELARVKPSAQYLTRFYLWISAGGATGAFLVGILAPMLFSAYWEFQLSLFAGAVLLLLATYRDRASWLFQPTLWKMWAFAASVPAIPFVLSWLRLPSWKDRAGVGVLLTLMLLGVAGAALSFWRQASGKPAPGRPLWPRLLPVVSLLLVGCLGVALERQITQKDSELIIRKRNFYGALSVRRINANNPPYQATTLRHGDTLHGLQLLDAKYRTQPTAYYGPHSGLGLVLHYHQRTLENRPLRIGAVGMGVGTIAAYAKPGDTLRFYEINPVVAEFSNSANPYFTFVKDAQAAQASVQTVLGDARLSLEEEARRGELQKFDVLVLDAFASDSVPVHLLTAEAFSVYRQHLRDENSIIAIHISSRAIDLRPVLAAAAAENQWQAYGVENPPADGLVLLSQWILVGPNLFRMRVPVQEATQNRAFLMPSEKNFETWTDDYSNVWSVLTR